MTETQREEWRDIAEAIQHESDSSKLTELVEKLCETLDVQHQRSSEGSPSNGKGDRAGNAA